MGLILYIKKQFSLFRFCLKRNSLQLIYPIINLIKQTPLIMKYYGLIQVLYNRLFIILRSFPLLKSIQRYFPFLLAIIGLIFRIFQFTSEILFCDPPRWIFGVLVLHHLFAFYELLLTFRILIEWFPAINPNKNPIAEFVYYATDPYFKIFDNLSPGGRASILAYIVVDHILDAITGFYLLNIRLGADNFGRGIYESIRFIKKTSDNERLLLLKI